MKAVFVLVIFPYLCKYYSKCAPVNGTMYLLPDFCPLGEPLRSRAGKTIQCNCPPHPFCPKLYYCKIAIQGQAGICCPDFGIDRRHTVKPEDSRLHSIENLYLKTQNCSLDICNQLLKSKDNVTTDTDQDRLISSKKDEFNGTMIVITTETPKQNQTEKPKCLAVPSSQLPELPDENLCKYEDVGLDKDGCPLPPKAKCLEKEDCPKTKQPIVPPGCKLGQENLDERGCPKIRELICVRGPGPVSPILIPRAPAPRSKQNKVPRMKPKPPGYKIKPGYKRMPMTTSTATGKVTMRTTAKPTATTTFAPSPPPCPVYPLPATLSPDCVIAPPQKDSRGCYLPLEIVCEKQPTAFTDTIIQDKVPDNEAYITSVPSADPTKEPRKCPEVHIPILQPGCRLLPAKYDSAGCRLLPEVTCDPTIVSRPKNTLECPKLVLPTMDPLCSFGPSRNDSNGCPMVPEVFCPSDLGETEVYTTDCPYIPPPYLPPGCMYGVARYDSDGCSIAPEVICPRIDEASQEQNNRIEENNVIGSNTSIVETTMVPSTTIEILPPNFSFRREFRDMLTAEFYHIVQSNISPDAGTFRRTTAIPYVTSGRFHFCRMHADCFHFREPKEWCETGHGSADSVWTDKSCHCAEDTIVPACVVERMHRGLKEWTFCADYSQCAINH